MKQPPYLMMLVIVALFVLEVEKSRAQKWFMPDKREALSYLGYGLSGVSYGFNQAIYHHKYGKGDDWIDISTSWKNKYKDWDNGDYRAAYFGSKGILVLTTDLAHLSSAMDKTFLVSSVVLNSWDMKAYLKKYPKKHRWKAVALKKVLIPIIIRHVAFEITFKNL